MTTLLLWRKLLVALVVAFVAAAIATAHSQGTTPSSSSYDQLLTEVRGLRSEIQAAAAASIRAQVLVARVQLQEQRIPLLVSELAEIRRQQAAHQSAQAKTTEAVKRAQDGIAGGLQGFEQNLAEASGELASMQQEEQRLRARETDLLNQIATEQRRWSDFNSRLDELERSLPKLSGNR